MGKKAIPWHYDHHMNTNQDANWCVTRPWFDYIMGTRIKANPELAESNPLGIVGVLIGVHMVIVMPGNGLLSPLGFQVRAPVHIEVPASRVVGAQCKKRGYR